MEVQHNLIPPEELSSEEAAAYNRCKALGQILDRVGNKWTIMVVGRLSGGPMRFNAIHRGIVGVSHRMLTLTLRGLEQDGLVKRTVFPTVAPKVEYELTDTGRSLIIPLQALALWAEHNLGTINSARAKHLAKSS